VLDKLTSGDFVKYINETFRLKLEGSEPLEVELIQVTELGSDMEEDKNRKRRPFSIIFRGPTDRYLPQSIYPLEHPHMGTLDIFLVPIGPDNKGMRFEAVFT
jgi:hypothetical protein